MLLAPLTEIPARRKMAYPGVTHYTSPPRDSSERGMVCLKARILVFVSIVLVVAAALLGGCGSPAPAQQPVSKTFDRSNWAELMSDPDRYKGATVHIAGRVFGTIDKNASGVTWQMFCDPKNSEWNVAVYYASTTFEPRDDEFVEITGTLKGSVSGQNAFGATLTIPMIVADTATIVDATAAASPAIKIVTPNTSQTQHRITVTLDKVEFAADETRVFLTVTNGSNAKANLYDWSSKAVQGDKQYDADPFTIYPEVQSDLLPGVKSSGVMVFPAMDPAKPLKFFFEVGSDNWLLDFQPYVFEIQP